MGPDLCGFMVNGHRYGVPVLSVEEIVRPVPITPVPGSDRRLAGIINLRGVSAAVIDLRRCLAHDPLTHGSAGESSVLTYEDIAAIMAIGNQDHDCRLLLMEDSVRISPSSTERGIEVFTEPVALLVDGMDRVHRVQSALVHPPPANLRHSFITHVYELEDGFLSELSILNIIAHLPWSVEGTNNGQHE